MKQFDKSGSPIGKPQLDPADRVIETFFEEMLEENRCQGVFHIVVASTKVDNPSPDVLRSSVQRNAFPHKNDRELTNVITAASGMFSQDVEEPRRLVAGDSALQGSEGRYLLFVGSKGQRVPGLVYVGSHDDPYLSSEPGRGKSHA